MIVLLTGLNSEIRQVWSLADCSETSWVLLLLLIRQLHCHSAIMIGMHLVLCCTVGRSLGADEGGNFRKENHLANLKMAHPKVVKLGVNTQRICRRSLTCYITRSSGAFSLENEKFDSTKRGISSSFFFKLRRHKACTEKDGYNEGSPGMKELISLSLYY